MEKNPTWIFKIGDFLEKKIKISPCSRHFFWTHERSEVPPASLARSVLKPCALKPCEAKFPRLVLHVLCWSRVHLSRFHLTTTPLSWQPPRSGGNELPTSLPPSLPPDQKMFFKLAEIFLIISSEKENFLVLAVFRKTFSIGKKSNFNFQNRGFSWSKNVL